MTVYNLLTQRLPKLILLILLSSPVQLTAQQDEPNYVLGHLLTPTGQGYIARLSPEISDQTFPLTNSDSEWYATNGFFTEDEYILPIVKYDENNKQYILYTVYDSETWEIKRSVKRDYSDYLLPESAVYVAERKLIYMVCRNTASNEYKWLSISSDDFLLSDIIVYPGNINCFALCISPQGLIYGFSQDGYLCQITATSGIAERLFKVSDAGDERQASYFNSIQNTIYRTIPTNDGTILCRYDLYTETESFIQSYSGIESIPAIAYDKYTNELRVPESITDLQVSFDTDVNKGRVSFYAPDKDLNGNGLSGLFHTIISLDHTPIDTIEVYPNTGYEKYYFFPDGEHTLTLQAYNQYGKGRISACSLFAGYDMPQPIQNISQTIDLPYAYLSWNTPEGIHGGTVDQEEIRYKIVRYPDKKTVADQKELMATDTLPSVPGTYYYGITAYIPKYTAQETTTESFSYDCTTDIPYTVNKWSPEVMDAFTIDDRNNDNATWEYYLSPSGIGTVRYHYSTTNQADDYLYFPPMKLQAGVLYEANLYIHAGTDEYTERFSTGLIPHDDMDNPSKILLMDQTIRTKETQLYKMTFDTPQDSTFRLYIHCSSEANHHMLYVDSLSIRTIGITSVPDSVRTLILTQEPCNPDKITLQCTAPSRTIAGEAISALNDIRIYRDSTLIKTFSQPIPGETIHYTDSVADIDRYQYKIFATNGIGEGRAVTREIVLGSCKVPYDYNFSNGSGFYTIVDNNRDNTTWHPYKDRFTGCMRYLASETADADDWLITPPIFFSDTTRYEIHVGCCAGLSFYPESMRIMLGQSPEPNALSTIIKDLKEFTFINDTSVITPFGIPSSGHYYIGIQACSHADRYAILLRDIHIKEYDPASSPIVKETETSVWSYKGHIAIKSSGAPYAIIYNIYGQKIGTYPLSKSYCEWKMPAGIYIIRIGNNTHKIVVQ